MTLNLSHLKYYLLISSIAILSLLVIVANPGYFSHDELQKLDHINKSGLAAYINQYVQMRAGDSFGTPVRPISFAVQGILALFMDSYPVVVHLFAVLLHALVACLLFKVVLKFSGEPRYAFLAALCFVISPTGILATGWSAALMDRLYLLFGLTAFLCSFAYVREGGNLFSLIGILVFSSMAILSKETAVVLPLTMAVFIIAKPSDFYQSRFWIALCVWALPIVAFMSIRYAAFIVSLGDPVVSAYKVSIENIPLSLLVYYAYPFIPSLTEAVNWVFVPNSILFCAILIHAILVAAIYFLVGVRYALGYLFLYTLFLAPILVIPIKAAHYLYGSGIALSCAIASILLYKGKLSLFVKGCAISMCIALILHTVVLEEFVYSIGICSKKVLTGADALYATRGRPKAVDFQAEPGAPAHILHRMFTGRNSIGGVHDVSLSISPFGAIAPDGALQLLMKVDCQILEK
jgi:hypothetical protein